MMLRNPLAKLLHDHRVALVAWGVVFVLITVMYTSFYPMMRNEQMKSALDAYPPELRAAFGLQDMTTPAGFLNATVFSLVVPMVLVVFSVMAGAWVIGADEDAGTLDLYLAQPVTRAGLLGQRTGAVALAVTAMAFLVCGSVLAVAPMAGLHVAAGNVVAACVHLTLLGIVFSALTIAGTAVTGSKTLSMAVAGGAAVAAYVLGSFLSQLPHLAWVRLLSPFHFYAGGDPVAHGLQWSGLLVLAVLAVVFLGVAVVAFSRRDVRSV